jgi:hypothetical protein
MTRPRFSFAQSVAVGLFGLSAFVATEGCDPGVGVPEANRPPMALARVLGSEMMGQNVVVDYMGSPKEITLDASGSKDPDGSIKRYRWLSGRKLAGAPGGAAGGGGAAASSTGSAGMAASDDDGGIDEVEHRWVPEGAPADWPADEVQPKVTLPEGEFSFVLWVEDNKGVVSQPSNLKVTVRTPLPAEVMTCVKNVYANVRAACKACVCGVDEMCQTTLTTATTCNETCWGLLSCIGSKCPDYRTGGPTDCLLNNCSSFLGGATAAGMIAPCLAPCRDMCRSDM